MLLLDCESEARITGEERNDAGVRWAADPAEAGDGGGV
jgi:hypothetical protein